MSSSEHIKCTVGSLNRQWTFTLTRELPWLPFRNVIRFWTEHVQSFLRCAANRNELHSTAADIVVDVVCCPFVERIAVSVNVDVVVVAQLRNYYIVCTNICVDRTLAKNRTRRAAWESVGDIQSSGPQDEYSDTKIWRWCNTIPCENVCKASLGRLSGFVFTFACTWMIANCTVNIWVGYLDDEHISLGGNHHNCICRCERLFPHE